MNLDPTIKCPVGEGIQLSPIEQNFKKFDDENPHVWEHWLNFCGEAVDAGRTILSASMIMERIRWEVMRTTTTMDDTFKISNNHKPYYARKFNRLFPWCAGQFVIHATKPDLDRDGVDMFGVRRIYDTDALGDNRPFLDTRNEDEV